jgi:hypothetical protein
MLLPPLNVIHFIYTPKYAILSILFEFFSERDVGGADGIFGILNEAISFQFLRLSFRECSQREEGLEQ